MPRTNANRSFSLLRDQLFWYLMILGIMLGLVVSFLPPLFPAFSDTFGANFEELGRSQLVFFGAGLVYSFGGGWFTAHVGLRKAAAISFGLVALGMAVVAMSTGIWTMLAGATLNGIGHIGIATSGSAIISGCYPKRRQTVFIVWGISASVGFAAGPAYYGWWLEYAAAGGLPWQPGVFLYAALFAVIGVWGLALRTERKGYDAIGHADGGGTRQAMRNVLRSPIFYLVSWWMFCHAIAQIGITSWIGVYARSQLDISVAQAAWFLSANAVGFFIGRTFLTWLTARRHAPELVVLSVSALMAGVLFGATILAPTYAWSIGLFTLAGVFTSGDAPSIQSYFGVRFTQQAATAYSLLGGINNIGAASGPYLIGIIGTYVDLKTGIWIMPVFMLALGSTALVWWILRDRHDTPHSHAESADISVDPAI